MWCLRRGATGGRLSIRRATCIGRTAGQPIDSKLFPFVCALLLHEERQGPFVMVATPSVTIFTPSKWPSGMSGVSAATAPAASTLHLRPAETSSILLIWIRGG